MKSWHQQFYFKLFLSFIVLLLGTLSLLFFIISDYDHLSTAVPIDTEAYLNIKMTSFDKLSENKRQFLITWLTNNSELTPTDWNRLFNLPCERIGLYYEATKISAFIKNSPTLKNSTLIADLPHNIDNGFIYFPSNQHLKQTPLWLRKAQKNYLFGDFKAYLEQEQLFFPNLLIHKEGDNTLVIQGKIDNDLLKLNILSQTEQAERVSLLNKSTEKPQNTDQLFIRNLSTTTLNNVATLKLPMLMAILQELPAGYSFRKNELGFEILKSKKNLDINILVARLISLYSKSIPNQVKKVLPDGSSAINLIADASTWQFKAEPTGLRLYHLMNELWLEQNLWLSHNTKQTRLADYIAPTKKTEKLVKNGCLKNNFLASQMLYSQLKPPFSHFLLEVKNKHHLYVCID